MHNRRVLITNDDGITARGIRHLARAFQEAGAEVVVVAPDSEKSAVSHAITLSSPMRMKELEEGFFAVSGTPADCTYMGLFQVLSEPPDMVLSGINNGYNLGTDIFYSGTFAGALEAAFRGVPAMAVSAARGASDAILRSCARAAVSISERILAGPQEEGVVFNMNHPECDRHSGIRVTGLGVRAYEDRVEAREDPKGIPYYWIGGPASWGFENLKGGEREVLEAQAVALTPLRPLAISSPGGYAHLQGEV